MIRGILILLACLIYSHAPAKDMIVVLDASNSMWGQLQGEAKILIARKALSDLIDQLAGEDQIGLIAYGHRAEGDCNDVEWVQPLAALDPARLKQQIAALNPRGKTPITRSVEMAFQAIASKTTATSIILLSDGVETCNADPCAAVKATRQDGLDFNLQVIGFDVDDSGQPAALMHLARGRLRSSVSRAFSQRPGAYRVTTDNAVMGVQGTMFEVKYQDPVTQVFVEEGRVLVESNDPTSPGSVELGAGEFTQVVDQQPPQSPTSPQLLLNVLLNGNPVSARLQVSRDDQVEAEGTAPLTLSLAPDQYLITAVVDADIRQSETVELPPEGLEHNVEITSVEASLQGPEAVIEGAEFEVSWTGPDQPNDYITIVPVGAEQGRYTNYTRTREGSPLTLRAPEQAGDFELRYIVSDGRVIAASRPITIDPAEAALQHPESVIEGQELQVQWTGPANPRDYITVVSADAEDGAYNDYAYTRKGSPLTVRAPEQSGDFEVRYVLAQSKRTLAASAIRLEPASGSVEVPESVNAGSRFQVSWTGPDNPRDYVTIVPVGSEPGKYTNYAYTQKGSPLELRALDEAGEYEVRYVLAQSKRTLASTAVTIVPFSAEIRVDGPLMTATEVDIHVTADGNTDDYINVVPAGTEEGEFGDYTLVGNRGFVRMKMPETPGDYEIRYVTRQSSLTMTRLAVVVEPVGASLNGPASVAPRSRFEVQWVGPNQSGDYIAVAAAAAAANSYLARALSRAGNPARIFAPADAGEYELRYVTKSGEILARSTVKVE